MANTAMVAWGGLVIGLLFGAVGQRSGFCLLSGLRQRWLQGDGRMLRSFALAVAVAVIGSQWLAAAGVVALGESIYLQPAFPWLLFLGGGLLFGYGMVMANACGARALVLLGGGNLRTLLVLLLLGVAGQMTLTGLLAPLRLALDGMTQVVVPLSTPTLDGLFAAVGLSAATARWAATGVLAGGLLLYAAGDRAFRCSPRHWLGGLLIGLLVPAGWLVTGHLGADDFEPVRLASITFIAPIGATIQYVMFSTGIPLGFGVTLTLGVVLGSFAAAAVGGRLQLQGFDSPLRMVRYGTGGILMGIGGALALGCTIGQGLTGLSTMAIPSMVALSGIVLGALVGLRGPLRLPAL